MSLERQVRYANLEQEARDEYAKLLNAAQLVHDVHKHDPYPFGHHNHHACLNITWWAQTFDDRFPGVLSDTAKEMLR